MSRVTAQPEAPAPAAAAAPPETFYPVKWVLNAAQASTPIILQSANGPCALLALANALLQTTHASLPAGTTRIAEAHLMSLLADHVSSAPTPEPELAAHAISDFLDLLPRLSKGMHINVRFHAPTAFEFTRELSVFDVFPARLLHGWLVDPQDVTLAAALGNLSYNQVVNELVRTATPPSTAPPSAPPPEAFDQPAAFAPPPPEAESPATANIRETRPAVMEFLESNSTQLTIYGLTELHSTMREAETAILFRNSHFYVIRKHQGEVYMLVTDEGYLNELNTVWEKLMDVNGESTFYNGGFQRLSDTGEVIGTPPVPTDQQTTTAVSAGAGPANVTSQAGAPSGYQRASSASMAPAPKAPKKKAGDKCVIQ